KKRLVPSEVPGGETLSPQKSASLESRVTEIDRLCPDCKARDPQEPVHWIFQLRTHHS
ncbi:hypothetical protein GBAR_LOCUS11716, partial [Geodia barretti]